MNQQTSRPVELERQEENQDDAKRSHLLVWLVLFFAVLLLAAGASSYAWWTRHKAPDQSGNVRGLNEDRAQDVQ